MKPLYQGTAATLLGALLLAACGGGSSGGTDSNAGNASSSAVSSASVSSSANASSDSANSSAPAASSSSSSANNATSSVAAGQFVDQQVGFSTQNGGTTGGAGGAVVTVTTGTELNAALCNRASKTTPIIIMVNGTINHGNTTKQTGQCDTQPDLIDLKGVENISIIGVGSNAVFDQLGIHIRSARNIIIRNVHVKNVKKSGSPTSNGGDAISMESDVSNVWVDHVTLEASGGEKQGYDGLFDMKDGTKYVTLSWSILMNSERGGLVGSSDSDNTNGPVTFHHNFYSNLNSRMPLLRHATAHSYNNYFDGVVESGMNPRIGGKIKAENNYFTNAKNPIGTFYTTDMGYWEVSGNIFTDTVTWVPNATNKEYPAGPNPVSTTTIAIPYAYSLDNAADIPTIVKNGAGAGKMPVDGASSSSSSAASSSTSSAASSSTSSSASSSSSSSASATVAAGVTGSWSEDFTGADATSFYTATYKALPDSSSTAMYNKTGGTPAFADGVMTLTGSRVTIGARGTAGTTASSTPGGIFTINGKSCTLTINTSEAGTGTGKFQVYVDNNTTSGGNSVHGSSSAVVNVATNSVVAGANAWSFAISTANFTGGSFLMLRTESSNTVKVDSASLSCS